MNLKLKYSVTKNMHFHTARINSYNDIKLWHLSFASKNGF